MARNTGSGSRRGAVTGRSQVYNPTTGHYVKRDTSTGKFIDVRSDGKPFKGVHKEVTNVKPNPNIDPKIAAKAEKAVIAFRNKHSQ